MRGIEVVRRVCMREGERERKIEWVPGWGVRGDGFF